MQDGNNSSLLDILGFLNIYWSATDRAALRLVSKQVRDAINLNVRHLRLEGPENRHIYEQFNMSGLVSELPDLQSINTKHIIGSNTSLGSDNLHNVVQGALLAKKLTRLELYIYDYLSPTHAGRNKLEAKLLVERVSNILLHSDWPSLQVLSFKGLDMVMSVQSMKGLLHLSTLTQLCFDPRKEREFDNASLELIQPGSCPCLRHLTIEYIDFEDPIVAIRAFLHLTGLERLSVQDGTFSHQAIAQIQPGSWPKMEELSIKRSLYGDDLDEAMKGLLFLTTLKHLNVSDCELTGEVVSQLKPGNWPHLQKLNIHDNSLDDDPVGAMKGLLCLTSLTSLHIGCCSLTGEVVGQFKHGDWPHLQYLELEENNFSDDPVAAMKGLLRLSALTKLGLVGCHLNGVAFSQIKPGDWPHLKVLSLEDREIMGIYIEVEDYSDDPWGAIDGLMNLSDPNNISGVPVFLNALREFIELNEYDSDD